MNRVLRWNIPFLIAFVAGSAMVIAHFVPHAPFDRIDQDFTDYFNIIAVFAFLLGAGNLLRVHLGRVSARHQEAPYSAVTLVAFFVVLIAGFFRIGVPSGQPYDHPAGWFTHIYDATLFPLNATMFSLLAFFVASAAFRAFRARTVEATLLLAAAFIILIGRTPFGYYLTSWLPDSMSGLTIPSLSNFIMSAFNTAGQRAIQMGIALGIISTSLKLILGIERSYLGNEE